MDQLDETVLNKSVIRIIAIAFFMEILDAMVLNTSLPRIAKSLHHNPIEMKAAITIYLLTVGIFIPVSGWCADRIGERRVLMMAISLFTLGSIGCAAATNLKMLVCFRLLQGVGGGFLMPVARLILIRVFSGGQTAQAMAKVVAIFTYAMVLGPIIGGAITTYLNWRYIFILNVPIGFISLFYINKHLPDLHEHEAAPFDWLGFVLLGASLGSALFLLDILIHPMITLIEKFSIAVFSIAMFFVYTRHVKRAKHPVIDAKIFANPQFCWIALASFLTRLTMSAMLFLVTLLLQSLYDYSAVKAGLFLVPMGVGAYLGKKLLTTAFQKYSRRAMLFASTSSMILLYLTYEVQAFMLIPVLLLLQQFIYGIVMSSLMTGMNSYAYKCLSPDVLSKGNSFYSAVIQLSVSFGIAMAALTMIAVIGHADLTHDVPAIAFKVVFAVQTIYALMAMYAISKIDT